MTISGWFRLCIRAFAPLREREREREREKGRRGGETDYILSFFQLIRWKCLLFFHHPSQFPLFRNETKQKRIIFILTSGFFDLIAKTCPDRFKSTCFLKWFENDCAWIYFWMLVRKQNNEKKSKIKKTKQKSKLKRKKFFCFVFIFLSFSVRIDSFFPFRLHSGKMDINGQESDAPCSRRSAGGAKCHSATATIIRKQMENDESGRRQTRNDVSIYIYIYMNFFYVTLKNIKSANRCEYDQ